MSSFPMIWWSLTLFLALDKSLVVQAAYRSTYIYIGSYGYTSYYYTSYTPYVSIGAIIGSIIGALSFIGFVIGIIVCVCCMRKRRLQQQQQLQQHPAGVPTVVQYPMTATGPTVSGGEQHGYPKQEGVVNYYSGQPMPPPYPMAEAGGGAAAGGPHVNNGYQWPAAGQTPYPTTGAMQPQHPAPGYLHEEQKF